MTQCRCLQVSSEAARFYPLAGSTAALQSTASQTKQRDERTGKRSESVFHYKVARKFKFISIIAGEDMQKQEFAAFLQRNYLGYTAGHHEKQEQNHERQ
ncbi:hypothetical protein KIF59_21530 [Enterobacter cloacae subsp. cloacae]|nr:hypothetical protein [Enterobacter cloacae subsp. cloacae]